MTLLSHNLRLTVAYVFEKRNRSPVPVMMISLIFFITEIPVSKYASSFRLGHAFAGEKGDQIFAFD
jgi:hypothetical protein